MVWNESGVHRKLHRQLRFVKGVPESCILALQIGMRSGSTLLSLGDSEMIQGAFTALIFSHRHRLRSSLLTHHAVAPQVRSNVCHCMVPASL